MHKCVNNTIGNVYHLEQWVDNFFPYSQKQLRFDQPVSIVFQSDEENASRMLGKTAYYDPESMQVVLYTDNRHPKDVMRSLSHELVHHAQNCRGDFKAESGLETGYAQNDPHLRQMEREAYTKGNLIFRDFEDLIKTGKINIEIDFSDSGEPKMSLKEWKNNEINTKLMKKWGLLKEEKNEPADVAKADDELAGEEAGEDAAEELEEGCGDVAYRDDDEELEEGADEGAGAWGKRMRMKALTDKDYEGIGSEESEDQTGNQYSIGDATKTGGDLEAPTATAALNRMRRRRPSTRALRRENTKISVREAKQITRRIIERIKLENK